MKSLILFILVSIVFWGCPLSNQNDCDFGHYKFTIPVSFVPGDSIIYVGDTVTITSKISRYMMDNDSLYTFDFVI
ncbi:MAG: hypothetical protein R2771_05590 [Saprospiraceae bacterium]